jgi:Tetratricopeptide repeat
LLAGLAMTVTVFAFVHLDFTSAKSWLEILSVSLTRIPGSGASSHLVPLVLLPSIGTLGLFASAETTRQGGRVWPAFLATIAVTGALAGSYAIVKAGHIAAIGALPGQGVPVAEIVRQAARGEFLPIVVFAFSAGILGLLAWACASHGDPGAPRFAKAGILAAPLVAIVAVAAMYPLSLRFVLAEMAYGAANLRATSPDPNTRRAGLDVFERAIRYDPFSYEYRLRFSEASLAVAAGLDVQPGNVILDRGVRILTEGHAISQINPISYALARTQMVWAFYETLPELRKVRALEARRQFSEALHFDPTADHIWVESAMVEGDLLGDRDADAEKMRRASSLFDPSAAREWAEAYARWSVLEGHPLLKRRYAERGIAHFRTAIESATRAGASKFPLLLGKGTLHRNLGQFEEALADFRAAAQEGHATDGWRVEAMLAHTLSDLGDNSAALPHAARALETAPKEYHDALNQLRAQLQSR